MYEAPSQQMAPDVSMEPELSSLQLGHLRHFANLAELPDHDWKHMMGRRPFQEDFGAFRFQVAYMGYALGVTHYQHLPAAPAVFQATFEKLIRKLLLPDVWMYWRDASQGGAYFFNAHLRGTLPERWDPVEQENIMYSAYVQSLALLYNVLFNDDRYAAPGALTMSLQLNTFGSGDIDFVYDQESLNENLYWQMVESGYLGIACEPNCVFQICNQPAILGFRMHDVLTGENRAEEVTKGWLQAWSEFGNLDEDGHYNTFVAKDTQTVVPNIAKRPWVDAWLGALLNMWRGDFVQANYERQIADLLVHEPGGTLSITQAPTQILPNGRELDSDTGDFGWTAVWASEMGDTATVLGLLAHADRYMEPTWEDGGLYYPRCDHRVDDVGRYRFVDPITGNVLLGWARLNVPNGLQALYRDPWRTDHFTFPALTDFTGDVDVTRARYDTDRERLVLTFQRHPDRGVGPASATISNCFSRGPWALWLNAAMVGRGDASGVDEVDATGENDVAVKKVGDGLVISWHNDEPVTLVVQYATEQSIVADK